MKSLVDEESSRNLTGVGRKVILGQHFLVGESEHVRFMQGMECGYRADGAQWDTEVKQQSKMSNKKLHSGVPMPEIWVDPWVGKIPWRRKWQPTPIFLLGKSHGQRSLGRL